MSNMSYCRFNNTASDVADCIDSWHEGVSSKEEAIKRKRLVELCRELLDLAEEDSEMVENLELNEEGDEDESE